MSGQRAAGAQAGGGTGQQWIGVVQSCGERLPGARQVGDVEQAVDALAARQQLCAGQMRQRLVLQRLQQAVQLAGWLLCPVELRQTV